MFNLVATFFIPPLLFSWCAKDAQNKFIKWIIARQNEAKKRSTARTQELKRLSSQSRGVAVEFTSSKRVLELLISVYGTVQGAYSEVP